MEGNLRFKIDWASLIVGSKFAVFVLFYVVFEGNFPSTSPQGAYNFFLEGLIHGGANFRNFTVFYLTLLHCFCFLKLTRKLYRSIHLGYWLNLVSDTSSLT